MLTWRSIVVKWHSDGGDLVNLWNVERKQLHLVVQQSFKEINLKQCASFWFAHSHSYRYAFVRFPPFY